MLRNAQELVTSILSDENATIAQINEAISTIDLAKNSLVLSPATNEMCDLTDVLFTLNTMKLDKSSYTADSFAAYETALANAQAMLKEKSPAISEVKLVIKQLQEKYLQLVIAPVVPNTVTPDNSTNNNNTTVKVLTKLSPVKSLSVKRTTKKKQIKMTWSSVKNASRYVVEISANKNFKKAKTYVVKNRTLTKKMQKSKKKYYVRVRAYGFNSNLKKIYSTKWISKSIKTK